MLLVEAAQDAFIAVDLRGMIVDWNPAAERMFGYTAAEVMNKITPADISDPQELIARAMALSIELATPITPRRVLVFRASNIMNRLCIMKSKHSIMLGKLTSMRQPTNLRTKHTT